MAAFYPGAGTDLTPVVLFPEIKTWYYMDSQPQSEHGDVVLYRPKFLNQLDQAMQRCGFKMKEVENHFLTYFSSETEQTIYYETSTVFPKAWDPVKHADMRTQNEQGCVTASCFDLGLTLDHS